MIRDGNWHGQRKVALNSNQVKSRQPGAHAAVRASIWSCARAAGRVGAFRFAGLDGKRNRMALCSLVDSQLKAVLCMMLPRGQHS